MVKEREREGGGWERDMNKAEVTMCTPALRTLQSRLYSDMHASMNGTACARVACLFTASCTLQDAHYTQY